MFCFCLSPIIKTACISFWKLQRKESKDHVVSSLLAETCVARALAWRHNLTRFCWIKWSLTFFLNIQISGHLHFSCYLAFAEGMDWLPGQSAACREVVSGAMAANNQWRGRAGSTTHFVFLLSSQLQPQFIWRASAHLTCSSEYIALFLCEWEREGIFTNVYFEVCVCVWISCYTCVCI